MTTPLPSALNIPRTIQVDLEASHPLSAEQVAFFRENGFIKLKQVLRPETVEFFSGEITSEVQRLNTMHLPMEQRTTYQKAFLQICNLWTQSDTVKVLAFAPKLAHLAADLLEVGGVRMYHDQALYKEPGGGITPWHADQYYWPVSSDRTITAWIPLQDTPAEMGPLAFARKTHRMAFGRELQIGEDSEVQIQKSLREAQADLEDSPFDVGEVSFHFGWTFHRAGANVSDQPRKVMTIIYVDESIRLAEPANQHQQNDRQTWAPGVEIGEILGSPLNPVLWSRR